MTNLNENGDQFGYFCVMSGCDTSEKLCYKEKEKLNAPVIMLGAGCYDFGYDASFNGGFGLQNLESELSQLGIPCDMHMVKGGHDWTVWPQLLKIFATNYLWK